MIAIYKRELKSYFQSFIGFLFIGVILFFVGLYFTVYNLLSAYPYFSYAVSGILFIFLISVPILTMRVLAEEKKQKTDQLILTAPVSVGDVVVGKFLALSTIFAIPTAIISFYPLILTRFGTVPLSESYLAILAFFLYGETCIAIGLFVSSLTESQVISAVITFALLFLGYMMSSICSIISSTGNLLTKILQSYDLYTSFSNMTQGTLNLESIAYYLSLIVLMLFLTVQSIQKRRYSVSVKKLSLGAYSTGMVIIAIAVTVVFNMAIAQIPESIKNVDVTSSKMYTLTDDTKKFLDTIEDEVTIYVMSSKDGRDSTVGQTLDRYEEYCKYITVEYVNPAVSPNFASQYTQSSVSSGSLIVVSDKRSTVINASDLYESSYSMDYSTYSYNTTVTGYDGEGQITSALDYVLNDSVAKVYFTEGHGEYSFSTYFTSFISALDKANTDYETINLLNYDAVPEDASVLMICGPITDFSEEDVAKVKTFMEAGGTVIAIYGYTNESMSNFDSLLAYMGLSVTEGMVVEANASNYISAYQYYLLPNMKNTSFTTDLYGNYYVFAPYAQGILIEDEEAEDISYTSFLYTSDDAFARTGYENDTNLVKTDADVAGPFSIGVCAEKTITGGDGEEASETTATLVLFSSEQMFTDSASQMVSGANQRLLTNTVNKYLEGFTSNISIPVKSYEVSSLVVTGSNALLLGVLTTIILPLLSLIAGFVIWFRRRKR
ncbi:MAG: Gldg family protein [Lachnospiraceae bacterium]